MAEQKRKFAKKYAIGGIGDTREDRILNGVITALVLIIGIAAMYPLWMVLIASVSEPSQLTKGKVFLWPVGLNWDAYKLLYQDKSLWIGYRNSLFYTVVGTTLQMAVTTSAAYALSLKGLPGRRFFSLFFLFIMYFSGGMIPTFFIIRSFGMLNTVWALLIPGMFGPYNMIICRTYFQNAIPAEVYESAQIEGAGHFRCFAQLAVPLAKPTLAVILLTFALGTWNTYLSGILYITDDNIQVLQVFVKRITTKATKLLKNIEFNMDPEVVAAEVRKEQLLKYAAIIVASVPMVMLFPFIRRYFVAGIMIGAVKG